MNDLMEQNVAVDAECCILQHFSMRFDSPAAWSLN